MTDEERLRAIHVLAVRTHDRVLEAFDGIGKLMAAGAEVSRELSQHRKDDLEAIGRLEAKIDLLGKADRRIRARVDSVHDEVEEVGKHVTSRRRKWDAAWRKIVLAAVTFVIASATVVVSYYFGKGQ